MTRALNITRMICGILVFTAGLNTVGAFGWEAPVAGPKASSFKLAMHEAGYFRPILAATLLVTGMSFVVNRYAALSAVVLFPVSLNILLFHSLLGGGQLPAAIIFFAINGLMLWYHREAYSPLLKPRL